MPLRLTEDEMATRFWSMVDRTGDCWLWTGAVTAKGYGVVVRGGRNLRAHRYAYELLIGPVPSGLHIDHLCRVRNCVNPAHLEPVTNRENVVVRGTGPSAINALKTHCIRDHEFTPENTLHDHPWPFVSIVLRGAYQEVTSYTLPLGHRVEHVNVKHETDLHFISRLHRTPTWTLMLVGRRQRTWGYRDRDGTWTPFDQHPHAAEFDAAMAARQEATDA